MKKIEYKFRTKKETQNAFDFGYTVCVRSQTYRVVVKYLKGYLEGYTIIGERVIKGKGKARISYTTFDYWWRDHAKEKIGFIVNSSKENKHV